MKKYFFGEIVLLKFPFTDGANSKKRPALILADTMDKDIIVCRVTSKIYKTEFDVKIQEWKKAGLKLPSVIRLHKIASLEKRLVCSSLGKIDNTIVKVLRDKLTFFLKHDLNMLIW